MENNNNGREIAEIIENSMRELHQAMEVQLQMGIRIGRRTTQIVRFGMAGLTILGAALFFLIIVLTRDFSTVTVEMKHMSGYMASMENSFTTVAAEVGQVRQNLAAINDNITVVPQISRSVDNMDISMASLSGDMTGMVEQIRVMNASVLAITANLQQMNQQFASMNITVGHMAGNVHQMAKPMKMLPFQ